MAHITHREKEDGSIAVAIIENGNTILTTIRTKADLLKLWKDWGNDIANRPALLNIDYTIHTRNISK